jgi:uncharacterized membrane protein YhaH (DUF805 family)
MNMQTLLLSPEGRIGRKDFWLGALILIAAWMVSHVAHVFAPILWLLLIYPWVCVYAKRLHDFGKSAWLVLIPFVVVFVCLVMAFAFGGVAAIAAIFAAANEQFGGANLAMIASSLGVMLVFLGIAAVGKIAFMLWVGISASDPAENRYGPPPGAPPPPTPAAPT